MNIFDFNIAGIGTASTERNGCSDGEKFDVGRPMDDWEANNTLPSDSFPRTNGFSATNAAEGLSIDDFFEATGETQNGHQKQPFLHQQAIPLPVSSQNDVGDVNNTRMFTPIYQPQHHSERRDPLNNHDSSDPQQLQPSSQLDKQDKDHRSMSPREQQHSVDLLLAKELNQLSFRERNNINEEIHGVSSLYAIEETPQLISQSLEQLQFEVDHNIPMHSKVAYVRSQEIYKRNLKLQRQQQPCSVSSSSVSNNISSSNNGENKPQKSNGYINDPDFLILFLRREKFVIRKAARRLVNFIQLVYELWGEKALSEKTWKSQAYLNNLELDVFRSGMFQVLQGRDRAGRRILLNFAGDCGGLSVENRLRISLYLSMAVMEDAESQKKGIVAISLWHNVAIDDFHQRGLCHKRMSEALPMRPSAIHFCLPHQNSLMTKDPKASKPPNHHLLRLIKTIFVMSIGSELRPHLRVHMGSTVECMYAMQSFGIHVEQIPVNTTTGKVKTKQHLKWLELKLQQEKALKENKVFNKIECPMIQDVLFGRGWPIMKHPGNVMLRNIIDSKLEEYQNEKTKRGKTLIAYSVVCMVKQKGNGGRFLKEDSGWWVEVSNDMARQKVSIAFRDARKLKLNHSKSSNGNSHDGQDRKPTPDESTRSDSACNPSTAKRKEGDTVSQVNYVQENDSSTSAFLGMDGVTGIKRQRCFDRILQKQ